MTKLVMQGGAMIHSPQFPTKIAILLSVGLSTLFVSPTGLPGQEAPQPVRSSGTSVIARVNGQTITEADLNRMFRSRKVEPRIENKVRAEFLDQLIDTMLMRSFLKSKKITVSQDELNLEVAQVKELLTPNSPAARELEQAGYSDRLLREELELPLLWRNYLNQTLTERDIEDVFKSRQVEFDGTQVRASQIFMRVNDPQDKSEVDQALSKMSKIRKQIVEGLDFAEAAKQFSESPSGMKGGDVGLFVFEGKMSRAFSEVAFKLKPGELSQPFATKQGVHLCLIRERVPGDISLEDARSNVMQVISNDTWKKTMADLRAKAKIQIVR